MDSDGKINAHVSSAGAVLCSIGDESRLSRWTDRKSIATFLLSAAKRFRKTSFRIRTATEAAISYIPDRAVKNS